MSRLLLGTLSLLSFGSLLFASAEVCSSTTLTCATAGQSCIIAPNSMNGYCGVPDESGSFGTRCTLTTQCTGTYQGQPLTCESGFCVTPSSLSQSCTTTSQCTGTVGGFSFYCSSYGICVLQTESNSNPGAACETNSQCSGSMFGYPLVCISNFCQIAASGGGSSSDSGSSAGGGAAAGGGNIVSCRATSQCSATQSCISGYCLDFTIPNQNCQVNGASQCLSTETCYTGVCIPTLPSISCNPSCNTANGEVCSTLTGSCLVPPTSTPICNGCDSGECLSSPFPGGFPICQATNTSCMTNSPCSSGSVCTFGYCTPCGDLCLLAPELLSSLFTGGNALSSYSLLSSSVVLALINSNNGLFMNIPNSFLQFDGDAFTYRNLNQFSFAADSAAQIRSDLRLEFDRIYASNSGAQLLLASGAGVSSGLSVSPSGILTVALEATSATIGGSGIARTFVNFTSINVEGIVNVIGDSSTVFGFPSSHTGAYGQGVIQVSGGVNLQGHAGGIRINIAGSRTTGEMYAASIAASSTLISEGSIVGSSVSQLLVEGNLIMRGGVFQPALVLGGSSVSSASASFVPQMNGAATYGGNISFVSTSSVRNILTIDASATGTTGTSTDGSKMYFKTLMNCPSSATLRLNVSGSAINSAADALAAGTLTLLNYDLTSYTNSANFQCQIEVCGLMDGICVNVRNPNVRNPPKFHGRRLLSDSYAAASFEPTKITLSMKKTTTQPSAAATTSVSSIIALLAAAVMAVLCM